MRRAIWLFVVTVTAVCISSVAAAETEPRISWVPDGGAVHAHGGATIVPGPLAGFGGGVELMATWSPLLLSLGGGWMWTTVDRPEPTRITTEPDVALPALDVDVEDRRLTIHTTARLTAPNSWALRPYIEAQASTVRWSSVYTLRFRAGTNSTEVTRAVDWSLGWGWGLGVLFPLDPRARMHFVLGFRRHYEGREPVRHELNDSNLVDAFPQAVDILLLGIVAKL